MPAGSDMDEETLQFFIQRIEEFSQSEPAVRKSADALHAMDRTWPSRRSLILQLPPVPLSKILETYPLLHEAKHLLTEFERVTGKELTQMDKGIAEYGPTLISKACEKSKLVKKLKDERLLYLNDEIFSTEHSLAILSLLSIPFCLREKLSFLMAEDESGINYPRIIAPTLDFKEPSTIFAGDVDFSVMVEETLILTTSDLYNAMYCMFACYYVFHLHYPKDLQDTLTFMQRALLGCGDKVKLSSKVVKLVAACATKEGC